MGLLGPLESFLCGPKSEKMSNVPRENDFFEKVVFFGVFELLMVLMGSSRLLLGRFSPRMDSNMSLKISSKSSQQNVNFDDKTCNFGQQKCRQNLFKMRSPP